MIRRINIVLDIDITDEDNHYALDNQRLNPRQHRHIVDAITDGSLPAQVGAAAQLEIGDDACAGVLVSISLVEMQNEPGNGS